MEFSTMKINEYIEKLSSKSAVPGGGGTSALVGALGLALGQMVGSLTVGKEKFQDVEPEMLDIMKKSEELLEVFSHLIDMDPEAFEPLMKASRLHQSICGQGKSAGNLGCRLRSRNVQSRARERSPQCICQYTLHERP